MAGTRAQKLAIARFHVLSNDRIIRALKPGANNKAVHRYQAEKQKLSA
jgi:hypothetical protein